MRVAHLLSLTPLKVGHRKRSARRIGNAPLPQFHLPLNLFHLPTHLKRLWILLTARFGFPQLIGQSLILEA